MNYEIIQRITQSPELALRQAQADQNMSPQADEGTLQAAAVDSYLDALDADLDGSSQEMQR